MEMNEIVIARSKCLREIERNGKKPPEVLGQGLFLDVPSENQDQDVKNDLDLYSPSISRE